MKFNFKEMVKMTAKGFKPNDIAELTAIDENKFDKDDILTLVGADYSIGDIKKLISTFDSNDDTSDDNTDDDTSDDNTDDAAGDTQSDNAEDKSEKDPADKKHSEESTDDKTDYKLLYEKEKKLREDLQHKNATSHNDREQNKESDFEIATKFAQEVLS